MKDIITIDEANIDITPEMRYSLRFGHRIRHFPDEMDCFTEEERKDLTGTTAIKLYQRRNKTP